MSKSTRIQLLQGSHLVRIVESDVGQSGIPAAGQADWEASVETADACDLPAVGVPVGPQEMGKGKVPVVTGYKVMAHVPGRLAIVTEGIPRVPECTHVVQRLGVGVGEQVRDVASAAFCRNLQRVVVRIS